MIKKYSYPSIIFLFIIALMVLGNSCANPGAGPGGGPRDTIAPVIISMVPHNFQTNFEGKEISIVFDEYVVQDNLSNKLMISPPLAEKPTIKAKGKGISIKLEEELIPGRTYSVDFKDGIKDYNEGNKLESLRLLFSTYDQLDTLRIEGYIVDAFTHEPVENTLVTLYTIDHDSVFSTMRPEFVAKVDEEGYFLFDNLTKGDYKLYSLVDGNSDLMYTMEDEQIAFIDTFISPTAEFIQQIDTLIQEGDTLISNGYTEYSPKPVWTYLFTEKVFNQYLTNYERINEDKLLFTFNESLTDSFHFSMIDYEDSIYFEFGNKKDSLSIWLTDSSTVVVDTLYAELSYTVLDSLLQPITQTDTLELVKPVEEKPKRKSAAVDTIKRARTFQLSTNLKSNNFDLNLPIIINAPSPITTTIDTIFRLEKMVNDSTFEDVSFKFEQLSQRKIRLDFEPEEATSYLLSVDSATINTLTGIHNDGFQSKFKTQKLDYYGTALFTIQGLNERARVQLLKNSKDEDLIKEITLEEGSGDANFTFLSPGKYKVKLLIDKNENGKWDTGNLKLQIQPEPIFYFNKIIEVKSNWDLKETWNINTNRFDIKDLTDEKKSGEE